MAAKKAMIKEKAANEKLALIQMIRKLDREIATTKKPTQGKGAQASSVARSKSRDRAAAQEIQALQDEVIKTEKILKGTLTIKMRYEKIISNILKNERKENPRKIKDIIDGTPAYKLVEKVRDGGEVELELQRNKKVRGAKR